MKNVKPANSRKASRKDYRKFKKIALTVMTSVLLMACMAVPAFASSINTSITTDSLVFGIIDFICTAAMYIGFVIVASGIFMFVMAYKDDNAESQSRGARFAVVGALLIGLKPLLKLVKIIK